MAITLSAAWELSRRDHGLAIVSTLRADQTIQSSLVNTGLVGDRLAFVTYGQVKLANLRVRPQLSVAFRDGWRYATVEGRAEIAGPEELEAEELRLLLREIFTAAGGTHDDWDEYDRTMREQRRAAVLITPTRVYGS
ncbi:TIGR03618 family F420-dependent PPOX class oxidoreductase [Actinoplanes sp. TRM 88003]|uniref:TIGR03618 family F420-dependent PPOX class oxidoreductase n=1 Tax=Paractinoplanes aksuensis TaxID=2939490 RepID=A0ABT1DM13_9ACTN|nr:TIGR03618 family F420-dependent PPOX class oxidoreductase [Actinoplanes aksuensis]MCO8271830.1 TIGR03618 family F420-dependent PPOX class oxidoreductase [Actinoplanes aksuensis]